LEINLRGYRPTIFVLHRGRWGTGEFRRQPFSDLWVFLQKDLALQTNPIIYDSIVAYLILQLLHKIHKSALGFPAVFALRWSLIAKRTRP
jgi:hypothetical protein